MKSPWKSVGTMEPDQEYVVFASSIPPKSMSSTWKMFRGSTVVRKQLRATDGVIGFSLLARPFRKQYATMSIWVDEEALRAFNGQRPHGEIVTALRPEMGPTKFARWTIKGSDGRPSWADALGRLG